MSTSCELGPPSLTPQKSPSDSLQTDPRVEPSISLIQSEALTSPSADRPSVGPFQGQDDSPESNTQDSDFHQSVRDPIASTGTPPGVSTVDLAVRTPVSRRPSDADMEALTDVG